MSASRERKKRSEQPEQVVPQQKKTKKLSEGMIFAIVSVALVLAIVVGLVGYRHLNTKSTVMKIGEAKLSVADFNYYCRDVVSGIMDNQTLSLFGVSDPLAALQIDASKDLDEQYVTQEAMNYMGLMGLNIEVLRDHEPVNGKTDVTWEQVVIATAKDKVISTYAIYNEAMAKGFQLDEHAMEEIEANIATMRGYADRNGESLDSLIERVYGSGCDEENYRSFLEVQTVVSHYPSTLQFSEEEINKRYDEKGENEDFSVASFYMIEVKADDFVEQAEDGTTPEVDDTHREMAKEAADEKAADFDTEDASVRVDMSRESVKSLLGEAGATWVFDNAKKDATKVFLKDERNEADEKVENTYYVVKLIDNSNEYATSDVLQLVVTSEEDVAAVDAAIEGGISKEDFMKLAEEKSLMHDVENHKMTRSDFNSISGDALKWCLTDRTAGEVEKFEANSATYYFFYVGEGTSYRNVVINNKLVEELRVSLIEQAGAAVEFYESAAKRANLKVQ